MNDELQKALMNVGRITADMAAAYENSTKHLRAIEEAYKNVTFWSDEINRIFQHQWELLKVAANSAFTDVAKTASTLSRSLEVALNSQIKPVWTPGAFFETIPNLTPIISQLATAKKAMDDGETVLNEAGYGLLVDFVVLHTYAAFARVDTRVRSASVTNTLLAETRGGDFRAEVLGFLSGSKMLRRPIHIIDAAILAHQRREYALSVPIFMAQVEGIVGDALIAKGHVRKSGDKLHRIDPLTGKVIMNKGNPVESKGLGALISLSGWNNDPVLASFADFVTNTLVGDRNGILHGRRHDYAIAKNSTRAILAIYILASEFSGF